MKVISKSVLLFAALSFVIGCDTYEFPASPYPAVKTLPVTGISSTSVVFQADITRLCDLPIIDHGFQWGFYENLSVQSEGKIYLGPASGTGAFETEFVRHFDDDSTYYVRSFIVTDSYTVLGKSVAFQGE